MNYTVNPFKNIFDGIAKACKSVAESLDTNRLALKLFNLANIVTSSVEFQNQQAEKLKQLQEEVEALKNQVEGVNKSSVLSKSDLDRITLSLGDE